MYSVANLRAKVSASSSVPNNPAGLHRVGYCESCSPFAGLFIQNGPNNPSLYILLATRSLHSVPPRFTVGQPPSSLIRLVQFVLAGFYQNVGEFVH
jgi:hypothetical protein